MHLAILIIAVILVGGGIFVRNKIAVESPPEEEVVLGESDPTATPTSSPTQPITPTSTPRASLSQPSSTNVGTFVYPNATITSQSPNSLSLQSSDDPQTITDWYKNKIKELGMSTRSFVQTKTNDTVHNVLAAAKNNDQIKITITKNAGESLVSIVVGR